ncbi:MAG: hypothetical protein WBA12_01475 [Catalinimonas sp.]
MAFLLLIFFLVATTIDADRGLLPKDNQTAPRNDRNVLPVLINSHDDLPVEER